MAAVPPIDIVLKPGDVAVGDARHRLRTLLGSCVSIVLWHAATRTGAMSHFLLAQRAPHQPASEPDGRYAPEAFALMTRSLARRGIAPAACEAHLVGGGHMFPNQPRAQGAFDIGRRNGEVARALLAAHGLAPASEDLFGAGHRQLVFDVARGELHTRQVAPDAVPSVFQGLPA